MMSSNRVITKGVLFAYFAGQASAGQKQSIESWVKDPVNEEFFYQCVHEWEAANLCYQSDVNQAIATFRQAFQPQDLHKGLSKSPAANFRDRTGPRFRPRTWRSWREGGR